MCSRTATSQAKDQHAPKAARDSRQVLSDERAWTVKCVGDFLSFRFSLALAAA